MRILNLLCLTALLTACTDAGRSQNDKNSESNLSATAAASVHGMVIFGSDQLFASHIPMYMAPHNYQALLQINISHPQYDAKAAYDAATPVGRQGLLTLRPKPFVLPEVLSGRQTSFVADLYKGNFEAGGKLLLSNVTVEISEVLYTSPLSKTSESLDALTYIPLQSESGSYLVHKITAPTNFDQVVQIDWVNPMAELLASDLRFPSIDKESSKLKAGQYYTIDDEGVIALAADKQTASFRIVSSFYCTLGPDFFNACI